MPAGDLTTIENVKGYLSTIEKTDQAHDPTLARLITAASVEFERKIGWTLLATSYTDTVSGDGSSVLRLRRVPTPARAPMPTVTVLDAGVKVDGITIPKRPDVTGTGWVLDDARVRLVGYSFTKGTANVEVAYTCGYDAVPADVEQAVIEAVVLLFQRRKQGAVNYQVLAGTVSDFRGTNEMYAHAQGTVERYQAIGIG